MISTRALFALAKALEGIPVLGSLQGSPAYRAGVRHGDVLLSVNGVRTRTVVDYVEAKALRTDGMVAVVFRAGAEQVTELAFDGPAVTDPSAILAELAELHLTLGADGGADPTGQA